jgi:prefoldin subunit 5
MTPVNYAVEALTAELAAIDYALRMKRESIDRLTERRRKVTEMLRQYDNGELAQIDEN